MDLFDFIVPEDSSELPLCPHAYRINGWSRDGDPESPYFGTFIDPNPNCLKPAHLGELVQ